MTPVGAGAPARLAAGAVGRVHGSCAARDGAGVLLVGPPGSGKSDLLLRLIDRGFALVADDQVELCGVQAGPPPSLAGLLEVRGLGILRLEHVPRVTLRLVVRMAAGERLPVRCRYDLLDLPMVSIDPLGASAAQRVALALDAVQGDLSFMAGAFENSAGETNAVEESAGQMDAAGMGDGR